jgi:hypothetical protein
MMKSMEDLFYNLLQDVYYAEKQLVKTLPKLPRRAPAPSWRRRSWITAPRPSGTLSGSNASSR